MNGSTTKTGRALTQARARFEAAGRAVSSSRPGLARFAHVVAALVSAARSWARAEEAHTIAMREYGERAMAEISRRRTG